MHKSSYSYRAKSEAAETLPEGDCCKIAMLSALIHTAGSLILSRGAVSAEFSGGNPLLRGAVTALAGAMYGAAVQPSSARGGFSLPPEIAPEILLDAGILRREEGGLKIVRGIDPYLIQEDCCRAAYLKGAFIGGGYVKIPSEGGGGYHLEFSFVSAALAADFSRLLAQFGFFPRSLPRGGRQMVYLKEGEAISDFLASAGAAKAVLELSSAAAMRDFRNNINRGTNCITANLGRAVDTGVKQAEAIRRYVKKAGLDSLPPRLKELAALRLTAPDADYDYFARELGLTKSGIKHRFERIMEIVKED